MLIRTALSALVLAAAAPALAAPATVAVPHADLDLTREAGRKTLDQRLARAVRQVCGGEAPLRDLTQLRAYRSCLVEARSSYQTQVEIALNDANARRVAVLATKLGLLASF